jgi:hypothetical protein
VDLGAGETFCHTNHFQDENIKKSPTKIKEKESPERLNAIKESVNGVKTTHELEDAFLKFMRCYPGQMNRKRLLDMTSGLLSFRVGSTGTTYLRRFMESHNWRPLNEKKILAEEYHRNIRNRSV